MKITDDKLLGHIRAIMYPRQRHKWTKGGKVPKGERKDILKMIRERQGNQSPVQQETVIQRTLTQEQWTRFARKFVEEVGDSKVDQTTGLSHKEVLDWVGKSQELFEEYDNTTPSEDYSKLRRFLAGLSLDPVNKDHFDTLFDD